MYTLHKDTKNTLLTSETSWNTKNVFFKTDAMHMEELNNRGQYVHSLTQDHEITGKQRHHTLLIERKREKKGWRRDLQE